MTIEKRMFKGIWIPAEVWTNRDLSWNEKILLMEVDSYTAAGKDCYISNEYIAGLLGINETNASRTLSGLIKKGYVTLTRFDGRHRYVESALQNLRGADLPKTTRQTCRERQETDNIITIDSPTENDVYIDNNIQDIDKSQSRTHTRAKAAFDFRKALIDLGVTAQVADDWLAVRKTKRATNTETAFRSIAAQIEKSGKPADDCIRFAAEHSWSGFRASWMNEDPDRPLAPARAQAPRKESIIEHYNRVNQELRERYGITRPDKQ